MHGRQDRDRNSKKMIKFENLVLRVWWVGMERWKKEDSTPTPHLKVRGRESSLDKTCDTAVQSKAAVSGDTEHWSLEVLLTNEHQGCLPQFSHFLPACHIIETNNKLAELISDKLGSSYWGVTRTDFPSIMAVWALSCSRSSQGLLFLSIRASQFSSSTPFPEVLKMTSAGRPSMTSTHNPRLV